MAAARERGEGRMHGAQESGNGGFAGRRLGWGRGEGEGDEALGALGDEHEQPAHVCQYGHRKKEEMAHIC